MQQLFWLFIFIFIPLIISLLTFLWIKEDFLDGNGNCSITKNPIGLQHLGSKTPYRIVQSNDTDKEHVESLIKGCKAEQIWMVIRHGTRLPSEESITNIKIFLPKLRDKIIEAHSVGNGTLCDELIEQFKLWNTRKDVDIKNEKILIDEGFKELKELAIRIENLFPELLNGDYAENSFKFRFTDSQRTRESAYSFARGLFEDDTNIKHEKPLKKDPILRFYKLCEKWLQEVDDTPEAEKEMNDFKSSEYFINMKNDMIKRLGVDSISTEEILAIYSACSLDTTLSNKSDDISPWCSILSLNDFYTLEYKEDLKYYYQDGYGYDVNHQQACVTVDNLKHEFKQATDKNINEDKLKGIFYFTHSGTVLKLLAHLGLYRDSEPLTHLNFDKYKYDRQWRVSKIAPFAANIAAILYSCDDVAQDKYNVLFMHQEKIIKLPICSSEFCSLKTIADHFNQCSFDEILAATEREITDNAGSAIAAPEQQRDVEQQPQPTDPAEIERAYKREERSRALRYSAGASAFIGAITALYYGTSQGGTSTLAGLLAPAAIMILYLLWVVYSTRANRSRLAAEAAIAAAAAAVAAAANGTTNIESNNGDNEQQRQTPNSTTTTKVNEQQPRITKTQSKTNISSTTDSNGTLPRTLNTSNKLRKSHRSTESLGRATTSSRNLNSSAAAPAAVHGSTSNLSSKNNGGNGNKSMQRHRPIQRSTMQLNNTRQVAAAAANLPSYEEALNKNHWIIQHTHSRDKLLKQPKK